MLVGFGSFAISFEVERVVGPVGHLDPGGHSVLHWHPVYLSPHLHGY